MKNGATSLTSKFLTMLFLKRYRYERSHSVSIQSGFPNSCIGYVLRGTVDFNAGPKVLHAGKGDVIYIPKGQKYISRWTGSPEIEFYSLNFEFRSNVLPGDPHKFQVVTDQNSEIKSALDRLESALTANDHSLGIGEFYFLYHKVSKDLTPSEIQPGTTQVRDAMEFIENFYLQDFTIANLATLCQLSESRFFTLFKKSTGCTPIEYKNKVRVQHAMNFLLSNTNTVEWISENLHFSSPAYFRRVFKSVTGKTPTEVRKQAASI